jgi:hypothetical protein
VSHAWLALNVHHRGTAAENRLLAGTVSPLLQRLEADGAVRAVWGTRFDARGPHLFLLVGTAPEDAERVREALVGAVRRHLARHPAGEPFTAEEVERRHAECRGKAFWAADRRAGIAPAESWEAGVPEPGDFPHTLVRGMDPAAETAYWSASTRLFHRLVAAAAEGASTRAAVAWVAAADRALRKRGAAEEAWSHHAAALLPPLEARLHADRAGVLASLPAAVTPRNRALFEAAWGAPDPELEALAGEVVGATLAEDARSPVHRLRALRASTHAALLLLGLPVAAHVPLVLHAWARSLPRAEAA